MLSEGWLDMMVSAAIDLELLAASMAKTVVTVWDKNIHVQQKEKLAQLLQLICIGCT